MRKTYSCDGEEACTWMYRLRHNGAGHAPGRHNLFKVHTHGIIDCYIVMEIDTEF